MESRALGVSVLLGPGANIKRTPLCGRNFEYFSEDPLVSGELGVAKPDPRFWAALLRHVPVGTTVPWSDDCAP